MANDYVLTLHSELSVFPKTGEAYTLGYLYTPDSDVVPYCLTVEDQVRTGPKVAGLTAIAAGMYRLTVTLSNRFKRLLPLLGDVPNFTGVRIHGGNKAENSEGCIIVGMDRTLTGVRNCPPAVDGLIDIIQKQTALGNTVWINIVRS